MSSERNNFVLYMFKQDEENMKEWVLQYPNRETGGDLFGLWSGEGDNAVIHVVLGPGQGCTHGDYHFYQDVNYLEKVGSLLTETYMLGHIGEWHSHHQLRLDRPSEGDCTTIQRNYPQGSHGFFLMIANIIYRREVCFSPYIFKAGSRHGKAGKVQVIAERSPFKMIKPISEIIREGKEKLSISKGNEKDDKKGKELIFLPPNDTTSMGMDRGSRESSSNSSYGTQNNRKGSKGADLRSTMMSPEYEVTFPANSDSQWYSKEKNSDIPRQIFQELHNLVEKVEITFDEYTNYMIMKFNYRGLELRLSFGPYFPIYSATLYANDRVKKFFYLNYDCKFKSYDVRKFVNEISDFLQKPAHFR